MLITYADLKISGLRSLVWSRVGSQIQDPFTIQNLNYVLGLVLDREGRQILTIERFMISHVSVL